MTDAETANETQDEIESEASEEDHDRLTTGHLDVTTR